MSLYPSLENFTIAKEVDAQNRMATAIASNGPMRANYSQLASDFLGLDLSRLSYDSFGNPVYNSEPLERGALLQAPGNVVAAPAAIVLRDPVEVTNGVREIKVSKSKHGKIGVQLQDKDNGVFITYVESSSPAAGSGLRFGDQILKINDQLTAAYSGSKAMELIRKAPAKDLSIIIRDR